MTTEKAVTEETMLQRALSRRQFITRTLIGASALAVAPFFLNAAEAANFLATPARTIALSNLHTGEQCALTYFEQGRYVPGALATINRILRDHRNDEVHPMDTALLDLLTALHGRLDSTQPFEVISGYRSPESNAAMHARSGGVASHSLHMEGKAIDIRVPGRELSRVHMTALAMGLGGVGYYPTSDFVHVDTGRVRQWNGA